MAGEETSAPWSVEAADAWTSYEALIWRLVRESQLTRGMAEELVSVQGQEAWLRRYREARAVLKC